MNNEAADWESGKDGNQFTQNQGVQITTGVSGANATSPVYFEKVSKIVVKYCTNASKGEGTIKVQVGTGTEKSFSVTKPSSGGTTLKDATFTFDPVEAGKVKLTANCTTNSIYIYSIAITHNKSDKLGAGLEYTTESYNVAFNASFETPVLTNPNNLTGITYSSSDQTIATVDETTGAVTILAKKGTTTITASFAGNDVYEPGSASYTINTYDPNVKGSINNPYTVAEVINGTATGSAIYVKGFIVGTYSNNGPIKSGTSLADTNIALADTPNETTKNNCIPVELSSNSGLRNVWGTKSKTYNIDVAQVVIKGNKDTYFGTYGIKGTSEITKVAEQVSISSAGMATYYTDCALDFTGLNNMWAYTAAVTSDGAITYTRVNRVPAETAVVLYNQNGAASNLVPVAESTETIGNNALIGKLADYFVPQTENGATNYLLNNGDNGVGFYKASGTHKVAAHRAYLQVPASVGQVRSFYGFNNGGISSGIVTVDAADNADQNIYDLQGRQVAQPTRGLYIVNGKKVIK